MNAEKENLKKKFKEKLHQISDLSSRVIWADCPTEQDKQLYEELSRELSDIKYLLEIESRNDSEFDDLEFDEFEKDKNEYF